MALFHTVFDMQKLKRLFYYFLVIIILLSAVSVAMVELFNRSDLAFMKGVSNSWILFVFLFAIAYTQGQISKKGLADLRRFNDSEGLFDKYLRYYKGFFLNCLPIVTTCALFVLTYKNLFFYLLLIEVLFSFAFFPRQAQILKELPDRDITFD
ncbi:MAG: hypothetical protein ABIN94_05315 [Ferruginibacter sp.]